MQHLRYSWRVVCRNPGLSLAAACSIVLGITLNAVIFSIIDWVWLNPSPFGNPEQIVRLFASSEGDQYGPFATPTTSNSAGG